MAYNHNVLLGLVAAAFTATAALAGSHTSGQAEKAVKARKAHMGLNAFNLGILGAMAKGEVEFNADVAQGAANDLAALAMMSQASYWPEGSSSDDMEGTRALPVAWTDMAGIIEKAQALGAATTAMAAAAGTLEGVQAAIGPVGAACGACHKVYRKPDS
ncbi:MAG: cytochrome c [Rhodobacter sp.]|jgi:cytochrome c556|nr:cytochrome c [Rhodobacter sp.]